jgi:hypothetical protein
MIQITLTDFYLCYIEIMIKKNTKYILLIILLISTVGLLAIGHAKNHQKYAGQRVFSLCNGGYVAADSLGSGVNGGGPCLRGASYIMHNDDRLYNVSLVLLGMVIGAGLVSLAQDSQQKSKKTRKK